MCSYCTTRDASSGSLSSFDHLEKTTDMDDNLDWENFLKEDDVEQRDCDRENLQNDSDSEIESFQRGSDILIESLRSTCEETQNDKYVSVLSDAEIESLREMGVDPFRCETPPTENKFEIEPSQQRTSPKFFSEEISELIRAYSCSSGSRFFNRSSNSITTDASDSSLSLFDRIEKAEAEQRKRDSATYSCETPPSKNKFEIDPSQLRTTPNFVSENSGPGSTGLYSNKRFLDVATAKATPPSKKRRSGLSGRSTLKQTLLSRYYKPLDDTVVGKTSKNSSESKTTQKNSTESKPN